MDAVTASTTHGELARTLLGLCGASVAWGLLRQGQLDANQAATGLTLLCASAVSILWDRRRGALAGTFLYMFTFWLFHVGLLISYAAAGPSVINNRYFAWVATTELTYGVIATAWAISAFTVGAIISGQLPLRDAPTQEPNVQGLGTTGIITAALGMIYVFGTYATNASAIMSDGYGGYLDAASQGSLFGYAQALIAIGCALAIAAGGQPRRSGWLIFLLYGLTALVIGARGSALFPLLALLAVEGRRRRLSLWSLSGVAVIGLIGISIIRQARHLGISGLFGGNYDYSPWGGMTELGQSFYPILVVQGWMDGGLEPAHGATIFASIFRVLETIEGSVPSATSDPRLLNVETLQMAGPIGSSPVAEGLRNGGIPGVVLFLLAIGLLVGYISRRTETAWEAARLGVVLAPVLGSVRNAFAPVPIQIALGLGLIALARYQGKRVERQEKSQAEMVGCSRTNSVRHPQA